MRSATLKTLALTLALVTGCSGPPPKPDPLPPAPQVVKLTATPAKLDAAGPVTIAWETKDATEVQLLDSAGAAVAGVNNRASGSVMVTVGKNTLFVLRATNARGVADTAAAYVELAGAPGELFFAASPDTISAGEAVVLAWSSAGAKTVKLTDGAGAAVDLKGQSAFGTVQLRPNADTTYTITADALTATAKVTVRPRITLFATMPTWAKPGGSVALSWKTAGATKVTLEGAVRGVLKTEMDAAKVAEGTFTDAIPAATSPSEVFRYRLIAESATPGVSSSQELIVYVSDAPQITEYLAPKYAELGGNTRLSWKTTAEQVEISVANTVVYRSPSAAVAAAGFVELPTAAMDTEYTLLASNLRGGSLTQKRTVESVGPITTTMFTATPQPGVANGGDPVTLTWAVPNGRVSKIEAKNQFVVDERSGLPAAASSVVVYPNVATTEYVLTVSNGVSPPVTLSQMVTVTNIAGFTYSTGLVPAGATIQLTGTTVADAGTTVTGLPVVMANVAGDVFVDIIGSGTAINYSGPDTPARLVTLPEVFTANIHGEKVSGNTLSVSINGWFVFSPTPVNGADDNDLPLPSTALEPLAIAPFWDDLYDVSDSDLYYRLDGAGANRRLIVQWEQVEHDDFAGSTLTFQAQVYASGKIVFAYKTIQGLTTLAPSVGVVSAGEYDAIVAPGMPVEGGSFTFFGPQTIPFALEVIPTPQFARLSMPNNAFIELKASPALPPNQFVLSEVHFDPLSAVTNGQWIEVESKAGAAYDLNGWTLDLGGGVTHVVASPLVLPANGRVLLGQSATGGDGLAVDYVYGPSISAAADGGTAKLALAGATYTSVLWDAALAKQGTAIQADAVGRTGVIYATGVTSLSCASSGTFGASGQLGTPKQANTGCPPFVKTTIAGGFVPIAAVGTAIPLTTPTEENVTLTLPSPISAGGRPSATLTVSTNGYLALGTLPCATATNCYNANRLATGLNPAVAPFGLIAPFWDNLQPNATGGIYRHRLDPDATPNNGDEVTIVSWEDFKPSVGTGALNFQVKFFENGNVEFHYGAMSSSTASYAQGISATTWLEDPLGRAAIPHNINSSTAPGIAPNSGLRFTRQ